MKMLLELNKITLKFPGVKKAILNHINYGIKPRDFVIILGSNGSGKSSLLKLIDRSYQPVSGHLSLDGKSLKNFPLVEFSRKIITLTQDYHQSLFCSLTVFENCLIARERNFNKLSVKNSKEFFNDYLMKFNPNLPKKFSVLANDLSGGEKQALALALSVLFPPQILLLDEHTSALDPYFAKSLMEITAKVVHDQNITCLMATHDLDVALQYGNRILVLQHGEILHCFEAAEKAQLTHKELLESCYEMKFK